MHSFLISIVIPCFNEEGNIAIIAEKILAILSSYNKELIFVDDGSNDNTLNILKDLNNTNKEVKYLSFSRNFGHQSAIKAGFDYANGDCIITMDADLQHPPNLLPEMIEKWLMGYDIVYTIRQEDKRLAYFKRKTSKLFYGLINFLSDVNIEQGSAGFRLLDKQVVNVLKKINESHLFFRGLIPWLGFKRIKLYYFPESRFAGKSKYSFKKMFLFALNGITSFSIKPLYLSTILGSIISILSFCYALYAIGVYIFTDKAISGWASVLVSVLFIGGIQLIMLGIIGEYLGKLFIQAKGRPLYIVKEFAANFNKKA